VKEQLALLPGLLAAHVRLTMLALSLGVIASVPLGVWASRRRSVERAVLGVAGVLQTIPSLALLAVLVPLLAWAGLGGIGFTPALIGLFLYSLLPVLRNTVTGLRNVDPAMIEAAQGVGMTPREALLRVELPLAAPVIVAGVRTAAVWTVGTATLATPVGAQSLGNFIFGGLQTRNLDAVVVGCAASAALALALDGLVRLVEVGLDRKRRSRLAAGVAGFVVIAAASLLPLGAGVVGAASGPRVTIGAKTFTEQYILAHVLAESVRRSRSASAETLESLGSTVVFDALESGRIDAYVDYSGTLWAHVLKRGDPPPDRAAVLAEVKRALKEERGIEVVATLGFENTYAFAMRKADADRLGLRTLSDLAGRARELRIGSDYELFQRPEWKRLVATYGFSFAEQKTMDPSLMYEAVRSGEVDVITGYSTDGRIVSHGLSVLDDDRHAIPPYEAVVLVRPGLRRALPGVVDALARLDGSISTEAMQGMNAAVDAEGKSPRAVAEHFLYTKPR
jgi:osmoprotectant transport system permease protein